MNVLSRDVMRSVEAGDQCPLCAAKAYKFIVQTPQWEVRACRACSNAWTIPAPFSTDYAQADFHAAIDSCRNHNLLSLTDLPKQWKHSVLAQTQLLRQHLPVHAKVVEIGCGEGVLLEELRRVGFVTYGIEPSLAASERARKRGLDVVTGSFPEAQITDSIDCVVLSHVLEHFPDPVSVLRSIRHMAPKARVLLVQSNYLGLVPRRRKTEWHAWAPEQHFWHFTPKGMEFIAGLAGFQSADCRFVSLEEVGRFPAVVRLLGRLVPSILDQFHMVLQPIWLS